MPEPNRLSVTFFLESRPVVGGGEVAIYRYAAALAERGHRVTVFAVWRNEFMDRIRPRGLRVHFRGGLPPHVRGSGLFNRWWARAYQRLVIEPRLAANRKPDFLFGYLRHAAMRASELGRRFDIPVALVVFETPDWLMRELGNTLPANDRKRLLNEWELARSAYENAALLIPLSRTAGQECARWIGRQTTDPVYPGVDLGAATRYPKSEEHILYVGRLDAYKNVQELIRALAMLKDAPPLVIAGAGYEEPDLRRLAHELGVNCIFRGTVTEEEKWRLLRRAYFLVFPSSFEGFGIPPAEALAAEKPAICSDIPVLREIYQDAAEFFPVRDVAALAEVMRRLLADPSYRGRRGREGREFIAGRYTWEKAGETLERILVRKLEALAGKGFSGEK